MRPYGAWAVPTEEDELEKALNRVPDEVSVDAAPFIQEGSLLAAGGGEPSSLEGPMVAGSKQSPADALKWEKDHAPPPQADTREAMLRKVFEAQQKHDEEKSQRMARGARLDRKRQNEDDLGAILYAATARKSPQFRNVGNSYSQEAASVGNDGPLSRELALQRVLAGYRQKDVDPLDAEKKRLDLENVRSLIAERGKPKGDEAGKYLTPAEQESLESQLTMAAGMPIKLPRDEQGRTRKDFVGPLNSSANMMGMMGQKGAIADEGFDLRRLLDKKDREEKAARDAAIEEKAQSGMEIPGWGRPTVRVSESDASKLRNAKAEAEAFDESASKLIAAIRRHGTVLNPKHPAYGTIGALMTDIIAKAKGPAAYELGVLAGPDMDLIRGSTGEPQTLSGMFKGPEDAISRLEVLRGSVKGKMGSKAKAFGYSPPPPPKRYRTLDNGDLEEIE